MDQSPFRCIFIFDERGAYARHLGIRRRDGLGSWVKRPSSEKSLHEKEVLENGNC